MYPVPPSQTGSMSDERKQGRIMFPVETGWGEGRVWDWRGSKGGIMGEGSSNEAGKMPRQTSLTGSSRNLNFILG